MLFVLCAICKKVSETFSGKFVWKAAVLNILSKCYVPCQNLKGRYKGLLPSIPYSVKYQVFTWLKNWIVVICLQFLLFILHGKEWQQPISRWVLPLCSECICKVLCWWLSWTGLQIGRNSFSTDAPNVEDSSACCKGLKFSAEMLNTCMHLCKYAEI